MYLGTTKEGRYVALMLSRNSHVYKDYVTGKRVRVNSASQAELSPYGICFYRPMPARKLGVRDLMSYVLKSIYCPHNAFRNALLNSNAVLDADNIFAGHLFQRYIANVSVNAAVMMRLMTLPAAFFKKFSSGELAQRASGVSSLCGAIVNVIFSVGLTAFISLIYLRQIFIFAPVLVMPALWIMTILFALSVLLIFGHSWILKQMKQNSFMILRYS